ncbi:fluoride export protein 1-like isoform X2 [Macadamia integrifolia]|uniref:fluoride export protein 1-like isoform X2 n=1 Tax=Macadamia integrifolia TaxID=60698 RepID=UPI001C4F6511|nr:fluoride export protein 1-like isoform X2 [Macadamia integrifolia]
MIAHKAGSVIDRQRRMKPGGPDDDSSTKTRQNHVTHSSSSLGSHYSDRIVGIGPDLSRSFGRMSSKGSWRSHSLSLTHGVTPQQTFDEIENASVSQAGDIGDRAIYSNRCSESGYEVDDLPIQIENDFPYDATSNAVSSVSPLPLEIVSPLSTDAILYSSDKDQSKSMSQLVQDNKMLLPLWFEYVSYLIHLAVFGILGVLTRYLLRELFGPETVDLTSDQSVLYQDLPSNMVGSFLMGWLGVVFKGDISQVSDILAIALTTGYLGSLTTFSGWNQKMLQLCVKGHWVLAVIGFFIGTVLVAGLITLGVETAKVFRLLLGKLSSSLGNGKPKSSKWRVNSFKKHLAVLVVLVLMLSLLWGVSGSLLRRQFDDGSSSAQLWFACMVAPPGVWLRWYLARLNGRGLGKKGFLTWMPFGTLIANVVAACVMAALSTVMDAVNTKRCDTIANGIQFGFLGCLSTVSTFMAEFYAMRNSSHPWRAYAYALTTLLVSFVFGTLIYTVPVLTKGYE